jgi:hypothetical protein
MRVLNRTPQPSMAVLGCDPVSHDDNIYQKELHDLDLTDLAELCANVARNPSADSKQSDTAHALHVEWTRLRLSGSLDHGTTEAEKSLQKRMIEFLAEVPTWMSRGL